MKTLRMVAAFAALSLGITDAGASDTNANPWYVGGSLAGWQHVEGSAGAGVMGRLTGGYRISSFLSAELGYARTADANYGLLLDSDGVGASNYDLRVDGVEFALRGEVPVGDRLSAFGRLGIYDWQRKQGGHETASGYDPTGGIGLRYALNTSLSFTGSFDYYETAGAQGAAGTRQLNLGAQWKF